MKRCFFAILLATFSLGQTQAIALPACDAELPEITAQLLEDLPSYGNRVIQRARNLNRSEDSWSYIITASMGDLRPLPLRNRQFTAATTDTTEQIFFTTLENQYARTRRISFENYYWLFLTPTKNGWAIAQVLSSLANTDPNEPANPPRDASQGSIGQAVRLWLRDFNAQC
ncbi:hypothetical protein NIES970_19670 [[Synechococcus] sp. NIES-970]|nr:hypothetical protein NIES970_19670 [[Synechococcus] sp. NIES-970]